MTTDPVGDLLRDASLQFEGKDQNLSNGCEEIILRGLSLIFRHPERELYEEAHERYMGTYFVAKGAHISIPPVNYEIPNKQNPSEVQASGLVSLRMAVPDGPNAWGRIGLELIASPHDNKKSRAFNGQGLIMKVSPTSITRRSYVGPVPGTRQDVNFTLGVINRVEEAVFPKKKKAN